MSTCTSRAAASISHTMSRSRAPLPTRSRSTIPWPSPSAPSCSREPQVSEAMELLARAAREGRKPDIAALVAAVPYCAHLGVIGRHDGQRVLLEMPFGEQLIGNPVLPALHGGVIGSLLET